MSIVEAPVSGLPCHNFSCEMARYSHIASLIHVMGNFRKEILFLLKHYTRVTKIEYRATFLDVVIMRHGRKSHLSDRHE